MKKVLSANADASLSVESIMEDVDVRGKMSRDQFEEMSVPILNRVREPLQQVRSGLSGPNPPCSVRNDELVGSTKAGTTRIQVMDRAEQLGPVLMVPLCHWAYLAAR